jgi:hypothetical protein
MSLTSERWYTTQLAHLGQIPEAALEVISPYHISQ